MCINKRKIVNPSKDFRFYDKYYIYGSCGDCEECRTAQHNQFYMRLIKEIENCIENNYNIYFCTLTYRNDSLPKFEIPVFDDNWKKIGKKTINCFSRDDWSRFYDSIVKPLRRKYSIGVNGSPRMRYFVACEYGSEKGRSHLHALFAVPSVCPPSDFYDIVKNGWFAKHGMIFPQSVDGERVYDSKHGIWKQEKPFQVNRIDCNYKKACYYCAKYACKESFFYSDKDVTNYLKHLNYKVNGLEKLLPTININALNCSKCELYLNYNKGEDKNDLIEIWSYYKELRKKFRKCLPFHLNSHGFGLSMLDDFKGLSFEEMAKKMDKGIKVVNDDMEVFNFQYPSYIKNKLLYNTYIVNDFGLDFDNERDFGTKRNIRRQMTEFGRYFNNYVHFKRVDDYYHILKDNFINMQLDMKYKSLHPFILPKVNYTDKLFYNLSLYKFDFKDRFNPDYLLSFNSFVGERENDYHIIKKPSNILNLSEFYLPLPTEKKKSFGLCLKDKSFVDITKLFNYNLLFKDYEEIIELIERYINYKNVVDCIEKKQDRIRLTRLIHS